MYAEHKKTTNYLVLSLNKYMYLHEHTMFIQILLFNENTYRSKIFPFWWTVGLYLITTAETSYYNSTGVPISTIYTWKPRTKLIQIFITNSVHFSVHHIMTKVKFLWYILSLISNAVILLEYWICNFWIYRVPDR